MLAVMPRARLVSLLLVFAGCSDPTATTGAGSTGDDTGASSTSSTGDATSTGAPTTGGSTTEPGFDPPAAVCGNGYVEGDEECDDANAEGGDGCSADCTIPCGLSGQVLALAPSGLSDLWVDSVAPAPDGGFVVVAQQREITSDQEGMQMIGPVRTRVVRYGPDLAPMWDRLLTPDDAAIDPEAGVVDDLGDIYVTATRAGDDGDDIYVIKLFGEDGGTAWTSTQDGAAPMSDDVAHGLALAPDGGVVVVGRIGDVDKDDDVWVRKLSAGGDEVWTTTWSGAGNGEFSTDRGGRVAVAPDGSVYVGAREYVNYKTNEAVLLKFGADGGPATEVFSPLSDGSEHMHGPGWVAVDGEGDVLFSIVRQSGVVENFWLYKLGPDLDVLWQKQLVDFQDTGDEWSHAGFRFDADGRIVVAGHARTKDKMAALTWYDVWTARLDPDGAKLCQVHFSQATPDLVPPSLYALDTAMAADGTALVGGQQVQNGEQQLWVGLFRPL